MTARCFLLITWLALVLPAAAEERYDSPIHFRPKVGRLADTIPFFHNGEYHIFYLRAIEKVPWEHIVSSDLVHWKELPTALVSDGPPDSFDGFHMFTGSVTEKDNGYHIYYTGWNPKNPNGREFVAHATSDDLITWKKHPEDAFKGDGEHYENTDFRDPFIAWNEEEKQYWMMVCARDAKTSKPVQGVLKSKDMLHWTQSAPLQMDPPIGEGTPECPDVFKIDNLFHIIHSPSAGYTDQRFATAMGGPYKPPASPHIDTPILYAAKRMFDGKRHIIHGWIRDLGGDVDGGDFQWGGDLCVAREVYAGADGQLLFRPAPEIVAVFGNKIAEQKAPALNTPINVPDNYMADMSVQLSRDAELSIVFREQGEANTGYRMVLRPGKQEAAFIGKTFDYARPVALDTSKPIRLRAFVQGSIIECFINDAYAFTCRAYNFRSGALTFRAKTGDAAVKSVQVFTP